MSEHTIVDNAIAAQRDISLCVHPAIAGLRVRSILIHAAIVGLQVQRVKPLLKNYG